MPQEKSSASIPKTFPKGTLRRLADLRDGKKVRGSDLTSKSTAELINLCIATGAVKAEHHKSRVTYSCIDKDLFHKVCVGYSPILRDIDLAIAEASGTTVTRHEKALHFHDTKAGRKTRTVKGFSIFCTHKATIQTPEGEINILPGYGCHVVNWKDFRLPAGSTIFIVENAEPFYDISWLKREGLDKTPVFVCCKYPTHIQLRDWLVSHPDDIKILYSGDFDLSGIKLYESTFKKQLKERISFYIPSRIANILNDGNRELYTKQGQANDGKVKSEECRILLKMIHDHQIGLEQEFL